MVPLVLIACATPDPLDARWAVVEDQRQALAAASPPLLASAADAALLAGTPERAVLPVCEGLAAEPLSFRARADALGERFTAADHADGLRALAACDPVGAAHWTAAARRSAHRAAIATQVTGDAAIATLALREGVDATAAAWVFDVVAREYVTPPDWSALAAEANARVEALRTHPRGLLGDEPARPTARVLERPDIDVDLQVALAAWPAAPHELVVAAYVEGALTALDPYTRVVWPAEIAAWEAHHAGVALDAGVTVIDDRGARITDLAPGGPAFTAGLHVGDRITAVDGAATPDAATATAALTGAPDTTATVTVERGGGTVTLALTRTPYRPELVTGAARAVDGGWTPWLAPGVAYVHVAAFRPWVDEAFDDLLDPHLPSIEAVVLDLRGNPGGDVSAAVNLADRFVAGGLLAGMDGRAPPDTDPGVDPETGEPLAAWNEAVPGHALEGVPTVVLVDRETASAAEICAGALQQRAGAVLVGEPTVGKGRSQHLVAGPRAALQITNVRWTLPDGTVLDGAGLRPDIPVVPSAAERFRVQLLRAAETRLRTHADGTPLPPPRPPDHADLPPLDADPARLHALRSLADASPDRR